MAETKYDVIVVGAGAGGGTMTRVLADKGIKVALVEAGPMLDPQRDFKTNKWPHDYGHRGAEEGGKAYFGKGQAYGFMIAASGGWQLEGEPYTTAPGTKFEWFRSRVVGGRTNHYGRMSFRFSDLDMQPYSRDGIGWDWPITYEDLAPWYDRAEEFIGVTGTQEGIRSAPDGKFHAPPEPKAHERLIRAAGGRLGIPFIANRRAVITRSINGRLPCHYCGQCGRGCLTESNYSASQVEIFPAMKTGNVTLITDAMVRKVEVDAQGLARGVVYVDKAARTERRLEGRAVVLAASACETARLMLNSKSSHFPDGIANGSGLVGRYLMDTVGFSLGGILPALENMPRYDTDGFGGAHLYAPWWLWDDHSKLDFPRGYHIEMGGGFRIPSPGSFTAIARQAGYGAEIKRRVRELYGSFVGLSGRGEMIPNNQSYMDIDPDTVDRWGIPVPRFHFSFSDYEWRQARHMERTFRDLIEAAGGTVLGIGNTARERTGIAVPGSIIHEVGTARMGSSPNTSVLNQYCQAHEVPNLFVADGASFVSNPDKNPTLTINALSWRTAEYLSEEMRKGNV
ncbi:MAG: GMC family oxidoreductase [Bryobacterales bacterium]|nr:GMC family oxidoreductase [Bryobacterales bacterium]